MRKFIHLRGGMAVGKTSTARAVISQGNYEVRFVEIAGKNYPYTYDSKKRWVVTGRYDKTICGGCDGIITNRAIMMAYLHKLMKDVKPDVIVFEAVMYGKTFKFGKECAALCESKGYEYIGVLLAPELDVALQNVYMRNGGKAINVDAFVKVYQSGIDSAKKLKEAGVKIVVEDASAYELNELYRIVEKQV